MEIRFRGIMRAIQCYCREVTLTHLMRENILSGVPITEDMIKRFEAIMQVDIQNQQKGLADNKDKMATAEEMLKAFHNDPSARAKHI